MRPRPIGIKTRKQVDHDKTPSFLDYNKLMDLRKATRGLPDRRSKISAKKWAIADFLDSYISGLLSIIKTPPKSGHAYDRELEELIESTLEIFRDNHIPLNQYKTPSGGSQPLQVQVHKIMNNAWMSSRTRTLSG